MEKPQTLAEFLGPIEVATSESAEAERSFAGLTAKQVACKVLESVEFRAYLFKQLTLGQLPAAVVTRLMDYAWGKPVERVEHSGSVDVTRIERIIVDSVDGSVEQPTTLVMH